MIIPTGKTVVETLMNLRTINDWVDGITGRCRRLLLIQRSSYILIWMAIPVSAYRVCSLGSIARLRSWGKGDTEPERETIDNIDIDLGSLVVVPFVVP